MITPALPHVAARFEAFDERFADYRGDDWWEHHFDGGRWTEGPLYLPTTGLVLFSDIPNDRILRWDEHTGLVTQMPGSANYANGRMLDRCGRVVTCEQGTRRVVRTEHDGSTTVLADRIGGARFNSPNDVVVASDGSIWFTDPSYGIDSDYEGFRSPSELDGCHVYRVADGEVHVAATGFAQPNGLAFSSDERRLYVVDSHHNHIRGFDVDDEGALHGGHVIADSTAGAFDGDSAGLIRPSLGGGRGRGSTVSSRMGRCSARSISPRLPPISRLAAGDETDSSSPPLARCTRSS